MGALIAVISMVVAVVVAQVTDHIRKHMKVGTKGRCRNIGRPL